MRNITKGQVMRIANKLAKPYGMTANDATEGKWSRSGQPNVVRGEHENAGCAYIISWEESPDYEWTYGDDAFNVTESIVGGKFYCEAINHWCLGFYPV